MAGQYRSQYFVLGSPSAVSGLDHVFHCSEIVIEFCELAHDLILFFFTIFFIHNNKPLFIDDLHCIVQPLPK